MRDALAQAGIDLVALDSLVEGPRHAADLGGDGFDGRPKRGVLAAVLAHHANSAFADLWGLTGLFLVPSGAEARFKDISIWIMSDASLGNKTLMCET